MILVTTKDFSLNKFPSYKQKYRVFIIISIHLQVASTRSGDMQLLGTVNDVQIPYIMHIFSEIMIGQAHVFKQIALMFASTFSILENKYLFFI